MEPSAEFDLEAFLPYRLAQAAEAASRAFQSVYRVRYGMTRPEWRVLAHLGQYGELTARDICRRADMHKTKVSRAVFALEKRRWLLRRMDDADRRLEHLKLSNKGRAIFQELGREAMRLDKALKAELGAVAHGSLVALLDDVARVASKVDL